MRKGKAFSVTFLMLLILSLMLAACGSETPEETASPTPKPATTARPLATPTFDAPEVEVTVTSAGPPAVATDEIEATEAPDQSGPTAVIVSGDSAGLGQPFTFDATQSIEGEQPIVGYEWEMGDGIFLFGITIQHGYTAAGQYTVSLTVTDQVGNKDTTSKVVEVLDLLTLTPESDNFLAGTSWEMDNPVRGTEVTLVFETSQLSGSAGCNTYSASYTLTAAGESTATISIGSISATTDTCTQEVMGQERGYLDSLTSAGTVTVEGDRLTMETDSGPLTFSLVEATE